MRNVEGVVTFIALTCRDLFVALRLSFCYNFADRHPDQEEYETSLEDH
jgi:hypothetical protein